MKFELSKVTAKIASYTPRRELHGEDPKPAATIYFEAKLGAGMLAMFHPTLRWALFHNPNKPTEGGRPGPIDDANTLRFPEIEDPIKWKGEVVGAETVIHRAVTDLSLPTCNLDSFSLLPMEGGLFGVRWRCACHPDREQSGDLAFAIGDEVELTVIPPAGTQADLIGGAE